MTEDYDREFDAAQSWNDRMRKSEPSDMADTIEKLCRLEIALIQHECPLTRAERNRLAFLLLAGPPTAPSDQQWRSGGRGGPLSPETVPAGGRPAAA